MYIDSVDCQWSSWRSKCSKSCGAGTLHSTRHKTIEENHGGTCSGATEQTSDCNTRSCPSRF